MRPFRAVVHAVLAGAATLAVLAGLPVALWVLGAPLLPDHVPSLARAVDVLSRPDDGRLLLGLLVVVGAVAWLILAASIVVEAVAVMWRRPGLRIDLPGFRLGHSIAAALIAAIIGTGAAPALAAPAVAAVAATAPTAPADVPSARPAPAGPTYDVQPRDTLWRVAEQELGDPLRWREIYELNAGRPQPDGAHLTEASVLRVGWQLVLPTRSASTGPDLVTVTSGESLSRIAAEHLGDPGRAADIFTDNQNRPQPDGGRLRDPDLLQPGWILAMPEPAQSPSAGSNAPVITDPPAPPVDRPVTPTTTPTTITPQTPPPERDESASPTTQRPAPPVTSRAAASPTHPEPPHAEPAPSSAALPTALWLSPLVLGGVLTALRIRRRRQLRHRRARHRVAVSPDHGGRVEWLAAATPVPIDSAFLDAALRGLDLTDWTDVPPPDLASVRLAPDVAVVSLAVRAPMPPPFDDTDDGHTWQLDATAELPLPVNEAGGHCAPFPTLVSVAADETRTLLVDLEHWATTTVTGPDDRTTGLLRHMAAELANSRWAEDTELLLVGFGTELTALNPSRLRPVPDLDTAIEILRTRITAARSSTERLPVQGVLDGRLREIAPDSWLPVVLLAAGPFNDHERAELDLLEREIGAAGGRCAAALVTTGRHSLRTSLRVTIDDEGHLAADGIGDGPWTAERMSRDTGAGIADILNTTGAPDVPVRPATDPAPWAADMTEDGSHLLDDTTDEPDPTAVADPGPTRPVERPDTDPAPPVPPERATASRADAERQLGIVEHQDPDLDADLTRWAADGVPVVPLLGILGGPTVRAPGDLPSARPSWFTEVLVYLALHPGGVTMSKATADLWPEGRRVNPATVRHAFYGARRWAGRGLGGDPAAPFVSDMLADDRYRLRGHLLDWDLFRRLRKRAQARHAADHPGAVADYQAALALIRGPVLHPQRPGGYAWLNNHDQRHDLQIPGFIVDTARELVDIALANNDTALARHAAETARVVDIDAAFDQPLVDLMRVAHAEGNPAEMEQYATILLDAREFDVPEELPPDTFAVFNQLLPTGPRRRP